MRTSSLGKLFSARDRSAQVPEDVRDELLEDVPDLVKNGWHDLFQVATKLEVTLRGESEESIAILAGQGIDGLDAKRQARYRRAREALLTLHAIADETCQGWGIQEHVDTAGKLANLRLAQTSTLSTIHPDRAVVLPKHHTSQVGMTLRSLSLNLSCHRTSLPIRWISAEDQFRLPLNVLLLPWPLTVRAKDFEPMASDPVLGDRFGYFKYVCDEPPDTKLLDRLLISANDECGQVDVVILPEMAIREVDLPIYRRKLQEKGVRCLIAGVHGLPAPDDGSHFGDNKVVVGVKQSDGELQIVCEQHKHHRWRLDRPQTISYQLGGVFDLSRDWWEGIRIQRRSISFLEMSPQLTLCPLICEDLARQEPVSENIRALGPSLVVALLMDGPQFAGRWSAQYASVLADDPGSAVLSLTSKGMVDRWRAPYRQNEPIVALWKDVNGPAQEIPLEDGAQGILMTLNGLNGLEYSADGRTASDRWDVTLGGWRPVRVD